MTQKGYIYPGWPLYHATSALSEVLEHGLLTRAELARRREGEEVHVTGGGTAHAISMTLDPRVGAAILVGLNTIGQLVRDELSLSELLDAGELQAPTGAADVIKTYELTPERVLRYDEGLRPFYQRFLLGKSLTVAEAQQQGVQGASAFEPHPDRNFGEEVHRMPEGAVDLIAFFGVYPEDLGDNPDLRSVSVSGWAPKEQVAAASLSHDADPRMADSRLAAARDNGLYVEMYKRMLAMSAGPLDPAEVYDPLFFLTSLDAMRDVDPEELWVVEAECEADWVCMSPLDAQRLIPDEASRWRVGPDFGRLCEDRLDSIARGRDYHRERIDGDRDWGLPEPDDTVVYLGRAMAEVRVYDSSLLTDLRAMYNIDDVEEDVRDDYPERFPEDLPVVAYPWFRPRGN